MTSTTSVSLTLRGSAAAVLTLRGPADPEATGHVRGLLTAALVCGARHIIVDLSAAGQVPDPLLEICLRMSDAFVERGGWLLVEGAEETDPGVALARAFRAYRETVAAAA